MKPTLTVIALVAFALPVSGEVLRLKGPDGFTLTDWQTAAVALQSRCDLYGYQGVEVKVDGSAAPQYRLEVSCTTGLTSVMRSRIARMSRHAAGSLELAVPRDLSEVEAEQFERSHAPEGSRWVPRLSWHADEFYDGPSSKLV